MPSVKLIHADPPLLVPMPFSRRYRVERPVLVKYKNARGEAKSLVVPAHFITDGASIPRPFWSLIGSPYLPEFITAAIVHDWCCENKWDVTEMSDLFWVLLHDADVGKGKAKLMRQAVQLYKSLF
ncbi:DUF1353 domain-containing protein [Agarivorans sp. B2Z047]|uniref:DUF1353 domain-containing protein n=1 Tax=Agarivorans sp. B2Z047 TaxID=2652721 RepID=UPI00128C5982|nr:DUF1353 domain-containing protein [Agarivorans sp. B2Z047]MPW31707.1 DUF1353 domain-containing protein [Agarivorans sp. B2Z047]UQN42332.1 DUF1353 domain-containing protein [Agarivorans sp. B2Z047]